MSRAEFMKRLRELLSGIPENEREEALGFYEDYFDDAGAENEQEVIAALGSPEKVAKTILDGLKDADGEQGEFSETGFSGYGESVKEEVAQRETTQSGNSGKRKFSDRVKGIGTGGWILILILAIFALPVLGPVLAGIGSALLAIVMAALAVLFVLVIVGVLLCVTGLVLFGASFTVLFLTPAGAAVMIGCSLLLIGIGILLTIAGIWVVRKVVPPIIRWIVKMFKKLFDRKEDSE